jgi:hypothetical protein
MALTTIAIGAATSAINPTSDQKMNWSVCILSGLPPE